MATPQSPVSVIGDPVAVMLVGEDSYLRLTSAARSGKFLLSDGTRTFATQYFRTLGLSLPSDRAVSSDDGLGILLVNGLPDPLVLGDRWMPHCDQEHYPTESDLVGYWQTGFGNVTSPGQIGGSLNPNTIPGKRSDPLQPGSLYGAGFFQFKGSSILYFNDGALKFQAGDKELGICWSANGTSGSSLGVAADMSIYSQSDLATFYSKTANTQATAVNHDKRNGISITAVFDRCCDDEVWWDSISKGYGYYDMTKWLMIVAVEPA